MTVIDTDPTAVGIHLDPEPVVRFRVRVRRPQGTCRHSPFDEPVTFAGSEFIALDWTQDEEAVRRAIAELPHERGSFAVIERQVLARVTRMEWVDG